MADPLSIAASVAGLISLSGQVISVLYTFAASATDARKSVTRILSEIKMMNAIFGQVQDFMWGVVDEPPDDSRLSMISLDHLVATLTGCVLVYSELEKHLSEMAGLAGLANISGLVVVWEKIKWAQKEPDILVLLGELERHKSSLNLMLSIIQCQNASEARKSMRKLHSIMHEILQSNHQISNQLQKLMARPGPPGFCDGAGVRADAMSIFSTSTAATARSFAFEAILRKSRAYKQKGLWLDNSSVVSHGNSINVCSWTLLSQLSLGELSTSEISVFELPIYPSDIWNAEYYDFSNDAHRAAAKGRSSQEIDSAITRGGRGEGGGAPFERRPMIYPLSPHEPLPFIRLMSGISDTSGVWNFPTIERYARHNGSAFTLGRPLVLDSAKQGDSESFTSYIQFPFPKISRNHCKFWYDDGKWYIKDLGSASGTFLENVRLSPARQESEAQELNQGAVLQLGGETKVLWGSRGSACIIFIEVGPSDVDFIEARKQRFRDSSRTDPKFMAGDYGSRDNHDDDHDGLDEVAPPPQTPSDGDSIREVVEGPSPGSNDPSDATTGSDVHNVQPNEFIASTHAPPTRTVVEPTVTGSARARIKFDLAGPHDSDFGDRSKISGKSRTDSDVDLLDMIPVAEASRTKMYFPVPPHNPLPSKEPTVPPAEGQTATLKQGISINEDLQQLQPQSSGGNGEEEKTLSRAPRGDALHDLHGQDIGSEAHDGQPTPSPSRDTNGKAPATSEDPTSLLLGELRRLGLGNSDDSTEAQRLLAGFVEYVQMQKTSGKSDDEKLDGTKVGG